MSTKRDKVLRDELVSKKSKRIYVEKNIARIIKERYSNGEIDTNSSYIYQKMDKLLDKRIYVPIWNMWKYPRQEGYVNIFDLHKRLETMIKIFHLPKKDNSAYTDEEKKYMEEFVMARRLVEERGIFVQG